MWSENEIMEVIAAAIIGAAGTVAALALSIWGTGRKDRALVEKDTELNSKEHDKLSTEHDRLSAEHDRLKERFSIEHQSIESSIRDGLSPIRQKTEAVHDMILEEKAKRETWYSNLSGSQRDMKAQFDNLQKMSEQWQYLITENVKLTEQNQNLKNNIVSLSEKYNKAVEHIQNLEQKLSQKKGHQQTQDRAHYRGPDLER